MIRRPISAVLKSPVAALQAGGVSEDVAEPHLIPVPHGGGRSLVRLGDVLTDAVRAGAVGKVDAIKRGARAGDRVGAVGRAGRNGPMDTGNCREVRWNRAARLLSLKGPVPEEYWIGRIAEIEDEDVVATFP